MVPVSKRGVFRKGTHLFQTDFNLLKPDAFINENTDNTQYSNFTHHLNVSVAFKGATFEDF